MNNILSYNLEPTHSSIRPWRVAFTIFCHWFQTTYWHASETIQYLPIRYCRIGLYYVLAPPKTLVPFVSHFYDYLSLPSHLTIKILPKYAIYILYASTYATDLKSERVLFTSAPFYGKTFYAMKYGQCDLRNFPTGYTSRPTKSSVSHHWKYVKRAFTGGPAVIIMLLFLYYISILYPPTTVSVDPTNVGCVYIIIIFYTIFYIILLWVYAEYTAKQIGIDFEC